MDKSKRRRRRENEELRLLVFVLSYSNYELGLYGIRLVDRLIESFPMLIRHVARRKQRHAGRSVLHGASYGLLDLGRDQSMAFRVLDIRLVLPILADEQTAINRLLALHGGYFLFHDRSQPRSVLQIEIVIIHREESVDIPFIPFLTNHPFSVRVRPREYGGAHFLAFAVNLVGDAIYQFRDQVATKLRPFRAFGRILYGFDVDTGSGLIPRPSPSRIFPKVRGPG